MIIRCWLPRKLNGIAWFPNLAVVSSRLSGDELKRVESHEQIHLIQQKELGYLKWLFQYVVWHFVFGYSNNPFEVDAREFQYNIQSRPIKNWIKHG